MSVTRQRPPGVGPPNDRDTAPLVPGRPLWQQFLFGTVGVLLVVGVVLLVVRFWAIPALQSRGVDTGIAGEATLAALQTQQALTPRPTATSAEVAPAVQPTGVATTARTPVTAEPTPAPAVAPSLAPTPRSTPQTPVAPAAQTTATPSGAPAAVGPGTKVPAANGTPYPLPTASPEVAAAVSDAYLHYWSVRADALLALDSSALDQVAAGDELAALDKNIESFREQGRALRTDVQHDFGLLTVIDDQAVVTDHLHDSSVYVDPVTHEPLPGQVAPASPEEAPEIGVLYKLELIDETWKVVQGQKLS